MFTQEAVIHEDEERGLRFTQLKNLRCCRERVKSSLLIFEKASLELLSNSRDLIALNSEVSPKCILCELRMVTTDANLFQTGIMIVKLVRRLQLWR